MANTGLRREDKIDERADDMFNSHPDLQKMEQEAGNDPYVNSGIDQAQVYANDPKNTTKNIDEAKSREQAAPWENKTGQDKQQKQGGGLSLNGLKKNKGATGVIIALFMGGGLLGGISTLPGILLVHLKEDFVHKLDTRAASMAKREAKIIASKMAKTALNACSTSDSVICKFTHPSKAMLAGMEDSGAKIEADGKPIDVKNGDQFSPLPKDTTITFPDSGTAVPAEQLASEIESDPVKSGFMTRVFNPLYEAYSDSSFSKVLGFFSLSKGDSLNGETDEKKINETVADEANGNQTIGESTTSETGTTDKNGAPVTTESGPSSVNETSAISPTDTEAIDNAIHEAEGGGKGGLIGMITGLLCGAKDIARSMALASRAIQVAQLIRYSFIFLNVADSIKAGTAQPGEVAALGTILTTVLKDNSGNITKHSATDGYGTKYVLGQGLPPTSPPKGSTSNLSAYIPGGGIARQISAFLANPLVSNPVTNTVCAVTNSTAGQLFISIASDFGIGGVANYVIGLVAAPIIGDLMAPLLANLINDMAGKLISASTVGEDAGDAFASGASQLLSQGAATGGLGAMSVNDAVAYENNVVQPYLVAQAATDRATLSPFDAYNGNTFLGSIMNNLVPIYSNTSSLSGILTMPFTILGTGIGLLNKPVFAADTNGYATPSEYDPNQNTCGDPNITSTGIAAGPFCNIINGIPPRFIDEDPTLVLQNLYGQFDQTTGQPISTAPAYANGMNLATWQTTCNQQKQAPDTASKCEINSQQAAELALFNVDQSVQKDLDGEDSAS